MIDRKEFEVALTKFSGTLSEVKDEIWASEREIADELFDNFIAFYWSEDIAKEQRYANYLKLKEEFGE